MFATHEPCTPLLRISTFSKHHVTPMLQDIDPDAHTGEVLALTGENGTGRSTLSKILCRLEAAAYGSTVLANALYAPDPRGAAKVLGIRMVLQKLDVVLTLTVAESLFLGELPRRLGFADHSTLHFRAEQALVRVDLDLGPWTPIYALSIDHQQMVEAAHALANACRVLILDEPMTMLNAHENAMLFECINVLRHEGVAVLYVSHHLDKLARIADRIVVLRDGKLTTDAPAMMVAQDALTQTIVGRDVVASSETRRTVREPWLGDGSSALRVTGLTRVLAIHNASLDMAPGEIFDIAGLVSTGRTKLLRSIFGTDRADAGSVEVGSPPAPVRTHSPGDAMHHDIGLLTEDRRSEGLMLSLPVATNIALNNMLSVTGRGWPQSTRKRVLAQRHIDILRIHYAGPKQLVGEFSSGNQQKAATTCWLECDTPMLLFGKPTWGVDIDTKFDVYTLLDALAIRGRALVVVSNDLREPMRLRGRINVMCAGRPTHVFQRGGWSQDALLAVASDESEESDSYAPQSPSKTTDIL